MKGIDRRKHLLRVGAKAVHVVQQCSIADIYAPGECVVGRDLPGSPLQAPHVCIDSKLRSQNQTSDCSLFRPCSSPGRDRIGLHCTWNNGSVGRAGYWALHNGHIQFRELHGAYPPQKPRGPRSAPPPRARSLPQRMAGRGDQKSLVSEVKRQAKDCYDLWRLLVGALLRVGALHYDGFHGAEWQMPYACDAP